MYVYVYVTGTYCAEAVSTQEALEESLGKRQSVNVRDETGCSVPPAARMNEIIL